MAERPLPDILLERYLLGELPKDRMREIERQLDAQPELRARLDALRVSNASVLKEHNPEIMARRLHDRLRREQVEAELHRSEAATKRTGGIASWAWARPAFAGALFLAVVSVPVWQNFRGELPAVTDESGAVATTGATASENTSVSAPRTGPEATGGADKTETQSTQRGIGEGESPSRVTERSNTEADPVIAASGEARPDTRLKGLEPALALFRKTREGAEPLHPGAKAKPGDVLRIGYRSGGLAYGAIFSVDGNGNVTRHWPLAGDSAGRLARGEALLPGAFELDAAPEYERFYLLASDRVFSLNPVLESLHAQKQPTHRDIKVARFDILKDSGI